jgi:hypothetical protein
MPHVEDRDDRELQAVADRPEDEIEGRVERRPERDPGDSRDARDRAPDGGLRRIGAPVLYDFFFPVSSYS